MSTYYTDTLYPLQDRVLRAVDNLNTSFYLTGGTALSRCYYGYRYSDDLDFFVNNNVRFTDKIGHIISHLKKDNFEIEMRSQATTYVSTIIDDILQLDFVNDVDYHYGSYVKHNLFSRIDNVQNILSNKLTALISRDEPKDVADIWIITQNIKVNWKKIYTDVQSKAVGIFPPDIAKRLETFPVELLDQIQWIEGKKPDEEEFTKDIQEIIKAMLHL